MNAFLSWYILITILGWLTFPLAYYLFPALTDRGYTLSRAFGMLFWGFVFWMFASLGIAQNDIGGLLLGLVAFLAGLGVNAWIVVRWMLSDFGPLMAVRPAIVGLTLMVVGAQLLFSSFYLDLLRTVRGDER